MKVILPVAGKGTRLYPHTFSKAKSLVSVAGKTVIRHIMDNLVSLKPEAFIIIHDQNGQQVMDHIAQYYPDIMVKYVLQKDKAGPAHAVWLAKKHIKKGDDVLIVFNDTMFLTDLSRIPELSKGYDGLVFTKIEEDYQRFGVVVMKNGKITKFVEKPSEPISKLCQVGLYYFKEGLELLNTIEYTIEKGMKVKGEYFLPTSFQLMIEKGMKFNAPEIDEWLDCGKPETLFHTDRYLLEHGFSNEKDIEAVNSRIIPPVYVHPECVIDTCTIGPNVSINKGCIIKDSFIENSIIHEETEVINSTLKGSLIGARAIVRDFNGKIDIGDNCKINY